LFCTKRFAETHGRKLIQVEQNIHLNCVACLYKKGAELTHGKESDTGGTEYPEETRCLYIERVGTNNKWIECDTGGAEYPVELCGMSV
jgi:hypothetical protein